MKRLVATPLLLAVSACATGLDDQTPMALPPRLAADGRIAAIEVRSAFYNPRDAFLDAFEAEAGGALARCATGSQPLRLVAFIHDIERNGGLSDADGRTRLPGIVELTDGGKVVGRYTVRIDIPTPPGGLEARRRAASRAFGEAICNQAFQSAGPAN
jgi:hypothetical protein